jgi:hypothetical protein
MNLELMSATRPLANFVKNSAMDLPLRSNSMSCVANGAVILTAAAKTSLLTVAAIASLLMAVVLWSALPKRMPPLVSIGLDCVVYAMIWGVLGRRVLKREVEGFA